MTPVVRENLGSLGAHGEILVPLPKPLTQVTALRSTLVQSSLNTLRARGHYEAYLRALPREYHEPVLHSVAASWMPIDVGIAHYTACDRLLLTEQEQIAIGNAVGDRVQGTFLATLARTGKNLGASPLVVFRQLHRVWDRSFQGGGCAAFQTGPKDVRTDLHGLPLAAIPYFRNAYRGVFLMGASLFAQRAFCQVLLPRCGPNELSYNVSWA